VYSHWEANFGGQSEFGLMLGLYSFGLEESNLFRRAEEVGRKAGVHSILSACCTSLLFFSFVLSGCWYTTKIKVLLILGQWRFN
jgi:hypothetical protein